MKKLKSTVLMLVVIILGIVIYGVWVEPYWLEIRHLPIKDPPLSKAMDGKTAILLSDLHISALGKREEQILKSIEEIKPDFIFLTGDYVHWNGDYQPAIGFLSRLNAKYGVWSVMGDYDYSNTRQSCIFCHLPGTGLPSGYHHVSFLRNSFEWVTLPEGTIWIGGVDEQFQRPFAQNTGLASFLDSSPGILLSHNPMVFQHIDENQNVLVLAGDTHGGQLPLPSWVWRLLGYEKNARYNQGWFSENKKRMYVTPGNRHESFSDSDFTPT